ncbi:aminodeoxychorismate lyase [Thiorhodococcus minor]|uniref:Aminodeoxychorismate lyase n=1 Tax=Thiorhodococcus minor TaxID=57489 RepID=A0A6M0JTL3_9GAMM|nr:aminodeoxychorismate lyase [Thiorhodococcus minor]NEV60812.1 aminodeoxychorismate lyase [Thiorhodococcus minor]
MKQLSFSFFRYRASYAPAAFVVMGFQRLLKGRSLRTRTVQLMGCGGRDGFSILPDLKTYVLVSLLSEPAEIEAVRATTLYRVVSKPAVERLHFRLSPLSGHGAWNGRQVLDYSGARQDPHRPFAVLTRARVDPARAKDFWRAVPRVRRFLRAHPGCAYAQGFGEHPLLSLATFSVWEDLNAMRSFAYGDSPHHRTAKAAVHDGWLSESLFARLALLDVGGDVDRYPMLARLAPRQEMPDEGRDGVSMHGGD